MECGIGTAADPELPAPHPSADDVINLQSCDFGCAGPISTPIKFLPNSESPLRKLDTTGLASTAA